jgi:hypothetical protein
LKFSCHHCAKRFASVDEPAPGRVYRIRCRCGEVIVVRGPPGERDPRRRPGESGADRPAGPAQNAAGAPRRRAHDDASPAARATPRPAAAAREATPVIADDPFARAVAESIAATERREVTSPLGAAPGRTPPPVPAAVLATRVATAEDEGETSVELSVSEVVATDEVRMPPWRLRAAVVLAVVAVAAAAGAAVRVMRGVSRAADVATAARPAPAQDAADAAPAVA